MVKYKHIPINKQKEIANFQGTVLQTTLKFGVSRSTVCRLREKFGTNNRRGVFYKRRKINEKTN